MVDIGQQHYKLVSTLQSGFLIKIVIGIYINKWEWVYENLLKYNIISIQFWIVATFCTFQYFCIKWLNKSQYCNLYTNSSESKKVIAYASTYLCTRWPFKFPDFLNLYYIRHISYTNQQNVLSNAHSFLKLSEYV